MTEKKFREIFREIGWKVRFVEPTGWEAGLVLKSPDGARYLRLADTAFDSEEEWSRRLVFENAVADLTGRPSRDGDGSTIPWTEFGWFIKDEDHAVEPPPWFQNLKTGEVLVSSVEEFAFKLSTLGF